MSIKTALFQRKTTNATIARREPVYDAVGKAAALGVELTSKGWHLHSVGLETTLLAPGRFTGQSPRGVLDTVYETSRRRTPADRFAAAIGKLGRDPQPYSALAELCESLRQSGIPVLAEPARARFDPIPHVPLDQQPNLALLAAFWYAYPLVHNGWGLSHLGEEIAGGGFIAEIGGNDSRIIPANSYPDGTPATSLAHIIAHLDQPDREWLCEVVRTAPALHTFDQKRSPAHLMRRQALRPQRRWLLPR